MQDLRRAILSQMEVYAITYNGGLLHFAMSDPLELVFFLAGLRNLNALTAGLLR